MTKRPTVLIAEPGPRPPYYEVAHHLWGRDCDFDSDGNSKTPDDTGWTELSVELRGSTGHGTGHRVDIDPASVQPLVLKVSASSMELAERAARFIVGRAGGRVQNVA